VRNLRGARVMFRKLAFIAVVAILPRVSVAAISTPFGGVTLIEEPGRKMAIANLCAPGVSIRATKYGERKGTPQDWAGKVGAEIASNSDFFEFPGWSWVQGRAKGGGENWPAGAQWISERDRSYWEFGPYFARNVAPGTVEPTAAATDVFGGHDIIISGGKKAGPWSGDFYNGPHTRTAFGIDAGGTTVYLMVTTAAVGVGTVADWMMGDAATAGAPPIATATNLDGGGSSQFYVKGRGQIISTGRLVNNHVGIFAKGSGPAPNCSNHPPRGYLDSATCDVIKGWAQDEDAAAAPIDVHLYFDGVPGGTPAGAFAVRADRKRDDLCAAIGSCEHGFESEVPLSLQDGKEHSVRAYAMDTGKGSNPELPSAKTFTCIARIPKGVRRHVVSPDSLASWQFRTFLDLAAIDDAAYDAIPKGSDLPAVRGAIIRADDGSPEVWMIDGATRRHVTSPAVARRWQLDLAKVDTWPAAKVGALRLGPALRGAPFLVKASGPAVDLIDDDPNAVEEADASVTGVDETGIGAEPGGGSIDAPSDDLAGACSCDLSRRSRVDPSSLAIFALLGLALTARFRAGRSGIGACRGAPMPETCRGDYFIVFTRPRVQVVLVADVPALHGSALHCDPPAIDVQHSR